MGLAYVVLTGRVVISAFEFAGSSESYINDMVACMAVMAVVAIVMIWACVGLWKATNSLHWSGKMSAPGNDPALRMASTAEAVWGALSAVALFACGRFLPNVAIVVARRFDRLRVAQWFDSLHAPAHESAYIRPVYTRSAASTFALYMVFVVAWLGFDYLRNCAHRRHQARLRAARTTPGKGEDAQADSAD